VERSNPLRAGTVSDTSRGLPKENCWILTVMVSSLDSSPVGEPVEATPARRPERVTLAGRHVTLVPLDASRHGDALWKGSSGPENESLWLYLTGVPFSTRAAFDGHLEKKAQSEDPLFLAIIDNATGLATGHASYMRIEPVHRCIEVGSILYTPALQQTIGATEAMYLMARHAFEDLGYRRYEWKCNSLNEPSRRAALRFGFTFEGIFRQHMIIAGRNRDTAWFSMLDSEWPDRKLAFESWLDPANFDASGQQKRSLTDFRR
jgi:RimJ/RimL family protein N-acetyltransferase